MAPFAKHDDEGRRRPNWERLVEALIIAVIVGALSGGANWLLSVPVIQEKIDTLSNAVADVKRDVERIRDDFYLPYRAEPAERRRR